MATIKAGTILIITYGAYSDKGFAGPFRVLKDFDQAEVVERAKKEFVRDWMGDDTDIAARKPEDADDDLNDLRAKDLPAVLVRYGLVEDVDGARDWEAGGYELAPDIWPEP